MATQWFPFGDCQFQGAPSRLGDDVAVLFERGEPLADGARLDAHIACNGRQQARERSHAAIGVNDEIDVEPETAAHRPVVLTRRLNGQPAPDGPPPSIAARRKLPPALGDELFAGMEL